MSDNPRSSPPNLDDADMPAAGASRPNPLRPLPIAEPPTKSRAKESDQVAGDEEWSRPSETLDDLIEEIWGINRGLSAVATGEASGCHVRSKSEAEIGQLWTNVFFSVGAASAGAPTLAGPPQAVVVTSAWRGDGATQIAASLALIGAESNQDLRIALVDFNLRRPGMAELLGIASGPGVTDVLEKRMSIDSALQVIALRNGTTLHVLAAGPQSQHPLALLKGREAKRMMAQLQERFDHVIIDTASANVFPDAQILGSMAGGVLIVVRAGQTPRETVAEVKKRLELRGVRCLGLVLNQRKDPIPDLVYRMT